MVASVMLTLRTLIASAVEEGIVISVVKGVAVSVVEVEVVSVLLGCGAVLPVWSALFAL